MIDPRTQKEGICGITTIGGTGIEWICIKKVHDTAYVRRSSDMTHRRGSLVFNNNPRSEQHYFVRRWPNRDDVPESSDS